MTPVSLRLLRAGEQSGNLGQMMERSADFYDEEISRWLEWFVKLFEPLLMTFIGLLIGVIVILMYIPIFELASVFTDHGNGSDLGTHALPRSQTRPQRRRTICTLKARARNGHRRSSVSVYGADSGGFVGSFHGSCQGWG